MPNKSIRHYLAKFSAGFSDRYLHGQKLDALAITACICFVSVFHFVDPMPGDPLEALTGDTRHHAAARQDRRSGATGSGLSKPQPVVAASPPVKAQAASDDGKAKTVVTADGPNRLLAPRAARQAAGKPEAAPARAIARSGKPRPVREKTEKARRRPIALTSQETETDDPGAGERFDADAAWQEEREMAGRAAAPQVSGEDQVFLQGAQELAAAYPKTREEYERLSDREKRIIELESRIRRIEVEDAKGLVEREWRKWSQVRDQEKWGTHPLDLLARYREELAGLRGRS